MTRTHRFVGNNITLRELVHQIRGDTIQTLQSAPDKWLSWTPDGISNHILWHAGHAIWLQDSLCIAPLTGANDEYSQWCPGLFNQGSRPQDCERWPSRQSVQNELNAQLSRILDLLEKTPDEDLLLQRSKGGGTFLESIIHGCHDEARHCGQMKLLLSMIDSLGGTKDKGR